MLAALHRLADWIVPPPPLDSESSGRVQQALVRQAAHLAQVLMVLSPPTAVLWVILLWPHTGRRHLMGWLVVVQILNMWSGWVARRLSRTDPVDRTLERLLSVGLVLNGMAWGSVTIVAMPGDERWHALLGMLVLAPLAVNAVFAGSVASFFWSFQLSLTFTAAVGLVAAGSAPARTVALVLVYALPATGLLARINRTTAATAVSYAIRNQRNAQQLRAVNDHLAHEASHDSLTGRANRQAFVRRVDQAMLARAELDPSPHVGVLFMDLDRFKAINDSLGHAAGDEVLQAAASRIAGRLRDGDLLARLGGDEFTVLLEAVQHVSEVEQIAGRVLRAFDEPFTLQGRPYDVKVSIGVACTDLDAGLASSGDVLRAADIALYEAKAAGRGVVRTFDARLQARIVRQRDDERQLRRAIGNGSVTAWFQPIVEMRTGHMVVAEALARWTTIDGVRSAGTFIDLVTSAGLEADLSLGVAATVREVREALRQRSSPIGIGLNVPPGSLNQLLDELHLEGDLRGLTLEITETGVITDLDGVRDRLQQLRRMGAAVWLDDFGQGQSSLSLVTELPLDGVKIDRSFVADMLTSRAARTIVIAIAEIGRCLGLDVVAEGVETPEQVAALSALGVTHVQGFLVSPAVDVDTFLGLVDAGTGWPAAAATTLRV